jgi:hypothetical protein
MVHRHCRNTCGCLQVAIEQLQSELTASRKEEAVLREEAQRVS